MRFFGHHQCQGVLTDIVFASYRILTDRFALPAGADPTTCDTGAQTWCGGTWNTYVTSYFRLLCSEPGYMRVLRSNLLIICIRIRENLDYIQDAGFTASTLCYHLELHCSDRDLVWISPVNQNYQGPRTAYGDPYHGYWMADITKLNDRFGKAEDLKALIDELHRRDMYVSLPLEAFEFFHRYEHGRPGTSWWISWSTTSWLPLLSRIIHQYVPARLSSALKTHNLSLSSTSSTTL